MERAKKEVQEREERKALTKGAGTAAAQPKMKISVRRLYLTLSLPFAHYESLGGQDERSGQVTASASDIAQRSLR